MAPRALRSLLLLFFFWGALAVNPNSEESLSLRLVGGRGRCQGKLQIRTSRQRWAELAPVLVTLRLGNRICAHLGCGSALVAEQKTVLRRQAFHVHSGLCDNTTLLSCFSLGEAHGSESSLELECSESVRLVPGQTSCSGWVQFRERPLEQWRPLCQEEVDSRGAEVLCRELRCGAPLLQGALSPLGQTFHCEGSESALMDCPRNQTRTDPETCPSLSITCAEPLRLVGGAGRCEGAVEAELRGKWRRVVTVEHWDLENAAAVCRALGCGSAVSTEVRPRLDKSEACGIDSDCMKKEFSVRTCLLDSSNPWEEDLLVVCSESVRLVPGQTSCSGWVQFRERSLEQWRPLCQEEIDSRGAEVLCRELRCGAPLLQGALSPLGQTFHCEGSESALMDCPRNQTRTDPETCPSLSITCGEPLRLVGGASRCEGAVEAALGGEWRRLMTAGLSDPWELENAAVVCRDLGCGSAVSTEQRWSLDDGETWRVSPSCLKKKTSSVRVCLDSNSYRFHEGLHVVCSGHQRAPEQTEIQVTQGGP